MAQTKGDDPRHGEAICNPIAFLSLDARYQEDGWRQLLPAGHFKAVDGRPFESALKKGWFIDKTAALRLIDQVKAKGKIMVDYEHASLHATNEAPASGWINPAQLKWTAEGLWTRPDWTAKARNYLDGGEYCALSAAFTYNAITGIPDQLLSVALVNVPALPNLKELTKLAALKFNVSALSNTENQPDPTNKETFPVDEYLKQLLAALGIELVDDVIDDAVIASAIAKIDELKNGEAVTEEQIADLKSKQVDLSKYIPKTVYDALRGEIASLKANNDHLTVDQLIKNARKTGRIIAAEEDYFKALGKQQGLAALKAAIGGLKPIAALSGDSQVGEIVAEAAEEIKRVLTDEERAVMEKMGLEEADFIAFLLEQEAKEQQ